MYKIFTYFPQDKPRTDITHIILFKTLHSHGFYGCVSVFQFVRTLFAEKDESLLIKYKSSYFISIARLKTTELHQSAVQQIQYSKNSL